MESKNRSLGQYAEEIGVHALELNRAVDDLNDTFNIKPAIAQLQAAVKERFGSGHVIVSGEQTIMPLPKNVAKLIAAKALTTLSDEIRVVNLRANLDLVASEGDMYKVWIPSETSQVGYVDMAFLSRGSLSRQPGLTAEGLHLDNDQLQANIHAFTTNSMRLTYAGIHYRNGVREPDYDGDVIDIFRQCYGLEPLGTDQAEAHMVPFPHPVSLAQGHENFYSVVQRRFGILPDVTVYESDLDPYLLRNGGYEVLARIWKSIQNDAVDKRASLTTIKPVYDDPRTPFNVSRNGLRLMTVQSGDFIHILDPKTHVVQESHHISDVLAPESEFGVSLRAIPRVMLYSMAGLAGHITGGGSLYNNDARELMKLIHLPYFPLWNFDSVSSSPIQYMSAASYKSRAKARQNTQATIDFTRAGKASIIDCVMSMYPDQAAAEIESWISAYSGDVRPETRVYFTNRAGQSVKANE